MPNKPAQLLEHIAFEIMQFQKLFAASASSAERGSRACYGAGVRFFSARQSSFINQIALILLLAFFFAALAPGSAICDDAAARLDFARHGGKILAALNVSIPDGYHAYSHDPGKAGLPTKLAFSLDGGEALPALYPPGKKERDLFDPSQSVFVYKGDIFILAVLPADSAGKPYQAKLDMLMCSNKRCAHIKRNFSGAVPESPPPLSDLPWEKEAGDLLARENEGGASLSLEEGAAPPPKAFAPLEEAGRDGAPMEEPGGGGIKDNAGLDLTPRYADDSLEIYSLAQALLLGLIAGLLLNAMPCVLPVLALKVSGLLLMGGVNDKKKTRLFREHNLCFAAGILTLFTLLAVILGAADLMWGQLYQNQAVLLVMLLIVFLMGLSMLGVFTLPAFDLNVSACSHPMLNSYLTGLVSTFLATPCSGPLLGGALAWAFTQPLPMLLAVFWSVGLGMALPYLVFSAWPSLVKILPRPGNWMYVFEHVLGFFLLGTSLYLLSILPSEKWMQILCVLLLVSLCAWLWGKFCSLEAPALRRRLVGGLGCLLLAGAIVWILQPPAQGLEWRALSQDAFERDLGHKNMLVEFTADWCPNCKFLEATVLSSPKMRVWKKKYGLELVKVDLTRPDEYADLLLSRLGGKSIPLTAIFPRGEAAQSPLVLRDLYDSSELEKALSSALGQPLRAEK